MSRKRKEFQRRQERKEKIQEFFGIVGILFLFFMFVWFIVNDVITMQQIRQNSLEEYTGSYSYEIRRTYGKNHHYYYLFSLDNGDDLLLAKGRLDNDQILNENPILTFQYTKASRERLFSDVYPTLSIETSDGNVTLIHLEDSHSFCVRRVWICSIILSVMLLLFVGLLFVYYFSVIRVKRGVKCKK